jgi:uncharacterized protein
MNMETPLFIENREYRLFGVLHEAKRKANQNYSPRALVICNPFAEESIISHRVIVNLARCLAENGWHCFRFDYMGEGDSEGNFEDATLETRLLDIEAAVAFTSHQLETTQVGLLGVRFGATLAAAACTSIEGIDPLIMIAPIVAGRPYLGQLLRSNLAFQMAAYRSIVKDREALLADLNNGKGVNVDGYLLTSRLYREMAELELLTVQFKSHPRVFVMDINKSDKQPAKKNIQSLCEQFQTQGIYVDMETVAEHFFWADGRIHQPSAPGVEDSVRAWLTRYRM